MYCTPGPDNSSLISTEKAVPSNPENKANIRYNVPISLALLLKNQRSNHIDMSSVFLFIILSFIDMFWLIWVIKLNN
jgi:hypothetical protein